MSASLELGNENWAVKSDALLGYKVINGKYYPREFAVTRGTTAARVNPQGVVELTPYNLLRYSEMFADASWTKTRASIAPNTTTAPDGNLTADSLVENTDTSTHSMSVAITSAGLSYTVSIYAKANQRNWINISWLSTANASAFFNLSTGTLGTVGSAATATITSVGDGWYRCTMTATLAVGANTLAYYLASANNTLSYTGNGTNGIFIWGAQLVEGTEPLDYLPTTDRLDVARIDYSLGSASLLLEPQRTNLALQSSSFDNASWVKSAGIVITPNAAISPSGVMDADIIDFGAANRFVLQSITGVVGTTYTGTFYIKGIAGETIITTVAGVDQLVTLDGTWQRLGHSRTASSASFTFAVSTFGGSTARVVSLWGAQLEAGAYATSYIHTTTASVTRNQDVVIKTGISSLIGQTQGTLFLEARSFNFLGNGAGERISLTDGTFNNRINIDLFSGGQVQMVVVNSTTGLSATITAVGTGLTGGSKFKIAVAYDGANSRLYVNGTAYTTIVGTMPTFSGELSVVEFNQGNTARPFFGRVEKLTVYPERLTNAELATLTTL